MLYGVAELVLTPSRERIRSCEQVAGGVRVEVGSGPVELDHTPDRRAARRLCRLATRIVEVEVRTVRGVAVGADVTAVWHRVPHTRPVPVGAALALVLAGVPGYLTTGVGA